MPRTFKKNRDLSIEDGEKESMLDNEDTNNDDRDREDREERMARPKRDFNRKRDKRDKMDRSAKSTAGRLDENDDDDDEPAAGGGGRRSSNEDQENEDEPAGAKDGPTNESGDDGEVEMATEKKEGKKWFKFGKGRKNDIKKHDIGDNEKNNDQDDIEKGKREKDDLYLGPLRVLEPLRTDVVQVKEARQKRLERLAALNVPEIHYVGQVISGRRISTDPSEGVICRWKVGYGKCWEHLGGDIEGQSHVGYCKVREVEEIALNHPIDLHFAEAGVPGWGTPHVAFQCFKLDWNGRRILAGYGFCHFPSSPGYHKIEVPIWRPSGTVEEEMHSFFLGRTPSLISHEPILESAWQNRCRLVTVSAGKVNIEVFVTTRHTKPHNFDIVQPKS